MQHMHILCLIITLFYSPFILRVLWTLHVYHQPSVGGSLRADSITKQWYQQDRSTDALIRIVHLSTQTTQTIFTYLLYRNQYQLRAFHSYILVAFRILLFLGYWLILPSLLLNILVLHKIDDDHPKTTSISAIKQSTEKTTASGYYILSQSIPLYH